MNIKTVYYQKTFNLGNYNSERIGVEVALNEGENAGEALDTARNLVEEYHSKIQKPETEQEKCVTYDDPLECINDCTTLKELKQYELISKTKDELKIAYTKKLKSLLL